MEWLIIPWSLVIDQYWIVLSKFLMLRYTVIVMHTIRNMYININVFYYRCWYCLTVDTLVASMRVKYSATSCLGSLTVRYTNAKFALSYDKGSWIYIDKRIICIIINILYFLSRNPIVMQCIFLLYLDNLVKRLVNTMFIVVLKIGCKVCKDTDFHFM